MGSISALVEHLVGVLGLPREPYVPLLRLGIKLLLLGGAVWLVLRLRRRRRGPAVLDFGDSQEHLSRR